ncbi:unnamed protein product [Diamesa tonsa]
MKMSKLSNQTNSQDPQAVNSRVFVGNLNTFQCSKTDVERMFQRYGRLAGISMHKGYAFVQFTNPFDARNACHGEDGRTVLSQILDVNIVNEPKAHQTGRKRQNVTKTGNDWDYYYDSYYASTFFPTTNPQPRAVKRQRLMATPQTRAPTIIASQPQSQVVSQQQQQQHQQHQNANTNTLLQLQQHQLQKQILSATNATPTAAHNLCNPDILICGNCREMFSDLSDLLEHKRSYCKLRFTCKCQDHMSLNNINKNVNLTTKLLCVVCKDSFNNPWNLMVHAQAAHMVNIYEIGESDDDEESTGSHKTNELEKINGKIHTNGMLPSCNDNGNGNSSHTHKNGNSINEDEMELNTTQENTDKKNNHSSSASSSPTDELLLIETNDNELIINTNGTDNGINGKSSAEHSPNDLIMSSSRSNTPSDADNGLLDSPPQACIMRTLSIDTKINSNIATLTLSLNNGAAAMPTQ